MDTGIEKVSSTLSVLPTNKEQVTIFSSKFIDELASSEVHPFDALKLRKSLELFLENIKPTLDQLAREEAEKHGEKEFSSNGVKITLAENGVKWDYSKCNDSILMDLALKADQANERLKNRQKFLQGIKDPTETENGTINPPIKSSTSGLRVSLL